eukprot:COSAG02_NODE_65423_length_258_cov_0.641509_2_plen_36_part_01
MACLIWQRNFIQVALGVVSVVIWRWNPRVLPCILLE